MDNIVDHFHARAAHVHNPTTHRRPIPLHLCLLGGPGAGKTYMATALYSMQMPNGTPPEPIMSISDFSCPASALPNGQTSIAAKRLSVLRKGVCFSMTEPWSGEAEILPEALYDFVERVRGVWLVVVIEEVSVMTLRTLVALDQRLRADTGQVFRRDQHYADGGFSTAWPHPTTKHVRRVVQTDVIGTNARMSMSTFPDIGQE